MAVLKIVVCLLILILIFVNGEGQEGLSANVLPFIVLSQWVLGIIFMVLGNMVMRISSICTDAVFSLSCFFSALALIFTAHSFYLAGISTPIVIVFSVGALFFLGVTMGSSPFISVTREDEKCYWWSSIAFYFIVAGITIFHLISVL